MKIDLSKKTILVTGANSGIGYAIAKQLLESNASVALHYNSKSDGVKELHEQFPNQSEIFEADFNNSDSVINLFDDILSWKDSLDVLVNNAGTSIMNSVDLDDKEWIANWNTIMNINLLATGILSKKALQHFKNNNGGRIINIASRAAFRGDTPDYLAYAASKAGMVALIKSIARGFGKDGITAFSIAPGFTRTAMAQKSIDKYGEDFVVKDIALNQLTEPKDIAPIVTLICSGEFDHGTGSNIDINAGSYVR